jgi:peptidyl-prolyl cis-trans isomerase D
MTRFALASLVIALASCSGSPGGPMPMNTKLGSDLPPPVTSSVVSEDILQREPVANAVQVKHILIGWKDLGDAYQGRLDPRAAKRTKAEAETEVRALVKQIQGGADFDTLMKQSSEDSGSAASARAFTVTPDAQLVIEFRQLSYRLKLDEVGVVQSDFGFHIIKRIE